MIAKSNDHVTQIIRSESPKLNMKTFQSHRPDAKTKLDVSLKSRLDTANTRKQSVKSKQSKKQQSSTLLPSLNGQGKIYHEGSEEVDISRHKLNMNFTENETELTQTKRAPPLIELNLLDNSVKREGDGPMIEDSEIDPDGDKKLHLPFI